MLLAAPALAQTRHAFIVGIDTYDNVPSLVKAGNDARAVTEALEEIGFRTEVHLDVDQVGLLRALSRFSGQLDPGDEVVFFFAGHGVAIDGQNYLLPSDVPSVAPGAELVVTGRSLPVQQVIDQFNMRGVRMSLLILDACRDNPFPQEGTRSLGRSVGLGSEAPPEGTFVMFSAGMGQQALDRLTEDDPNPNSVFTRVLLPRLTEPGLPLRQMVQEVRSEVRQLGRTIGHEQFPAVYDQLDGSFAFVEDEAVEAASVAATAVTSVPIDPCAAARTDWDIVGNTDSVAVLQAYRDAHSDCPLMVAMATHQLSSLQQETAPDPQPVPAPAAVPEPEPEPEIALPSCWFSDRRLQIADSDTLVPVHTGIDDRSPVIRRLAGGINVTLHDMDTVFTSYSQSICADICLDFFNGHGRYSQIARLNQCLLGDHLIARIQLENGTTGFVSLRHLEAR